MGLIIERMDIFQGAVTINDVYAKIRDIQVTKEDGKYKLSFSVFFTLSDKIIDNTIISKLYDEVPDEEAWGLSYSLLKEILTGDGLEFTDA